MRLTAVVDGVRHDRLQPPGEAAIAVGEEDGEHEADYAQVHLLGLESCCTVDQTALVVCSGGRGRTGLQLETTSKHASTHARELTAEFSGNPDLPLLAVNLRVDGDSVVVSQPEGLDHPLLQSLRHVLLGHVEDPQVWKASRRGGGGGGENERRGVPAGSGLDAVLQT